MADRSLLSVTSAPGLRGVSEPIYHTIVPDTRSGPASLYRHAFRYPGRKPWNVIREYIRHFAPEPGQLIVDPFGGGGVTMGESLRLGRRSFAMDVQPVSELIHCAMLAPVRLETLVAHLEVITRKVRPQLEHVTASEAARNQVIGAHDISFLRAAPPRGVQRPGIDTYLDTVAPDHLAGLLVVRDAILEVDSEHTRTLLWLAFANMLFYASRNFHGKKGKGLTQPWSGDNILNAYGRMGGFEHSLHVPIEQIFDHCIARLLKFKRVDEHDFGAYLRTERPARFERGDARRLGERFAEAFGGAEADYVITDPPYGALVSYTDVFAYWNTWLPGGAVAREVPLETAAATRQGKPEFVEGLVGILREASEVLKVGGWMSIFYLDITDFKLWHRLVEEAADAKLELVNSSWMVQPIASRTQLQNPMSGIRGAVIANFRRVRTGRPVTVSPAEESRPVATPYNYLRYELQRIVVQNLGATTSEILAHLSDEIFTRINLQLIDAQGTKSFPKLLEELGARDLRQLQAGGNADQQIWTIAPDVRLDPMLDAYDRLRFSLFRHLSLHEPLGSTELARVAFTELDDVRPEEVPEPGLEGILATFASRQARRGAWSVDWARRRAEVQLRLLLSRSSAHALREVIERRYSEMPPSSNSNRLHIDMAGFAALASAAPGGIATPAWSRISQALLVMLRTLRDEFGDLIHQVEAVHETSRGLWDREDPRYDDLPLLVTLREQVDIPLDLEYLLLNAVFAPLFERTRIDFTPYFRAAGSPDIDAMFGEHANPITLLTRETTLQHPVTFRGYAQIA